MNVDVGKKEKSCRGGRCDLDCCMVSMKCIHEENGRGTYDGKGDGALDPFYLLPWADRHAKMSVVIPGHAGGSGF